MKQVKVKNDFTIGKNYYFKNDTLDLSKLKYEQIVKINEKGYIVPGLGDAGDRIFGTK